MKRTSFKVKRSKVKITRLINAETESVSPTNFKLDKRLDLEHALSTAQPAKGACEVWLLHCLLLAANVVDRRWEYTNCYTANMSSGV